MRVFVAIKLKVNFVNTKVSTSTYMFNLYIFFIWWSTYKCEKNYFWGIFKDKM